VASRRPLRRRRGGGGEGVRTLARARFLASVFALRRLLQIFYLFIYSLCVIGSRRLFVCDSLQVVQTTLIFSRSPINSIL
jgi:hypothetical protein